MALISERKQNVESSGSYSIVFNNKELGKLITAIHGTSIANGSQLEKMILEKSEVKIIKNVAEFQKILDKNFDNQKLWIIPKLIVKKGFNLKNKNEPDFLVIQKQNENMYIIELKMGWVFDTKKVKGEWKQLKEFSNDISNLVSYKTKIFVCSFNANNIEQMYNGFKKIIKKENLMTGQQFCSLINLDYNKIKSIFDNDSKQNLNFFIESILKIPEIKTILLKKIKN